MTDKIQELIDTIDWVIKYAEPDGEEIRHLQALSNALTKTNEAFERRYLLELQFLGAEKLECAMCGAPNSFVIDSANPSIGYCLAENMQFSLKANLDELEKLRG